MREGTHVKRASKKLIVFCLAAALSVAGLTALVTSAVGAVSDADVHQNSANYQSYVCNNCHDKFGTVSGGAGGWWDPHRRHFVSVFLNFVGNQGGIDAYGCAKCHRETTPPTYSEGDPSVVKPNSTNDAGRNVNAAVCRECHGQFRKSKHRFNGVEHDYVAQPRECIDCHNPGGPGLDPEVAHGSLPLESSSSIDPFAAGIWWINQRYANLKDFCIRCHGSFAWYKVEETNPGISCGYELCHKTSAESFLDTVPEFLEDATVSGSHRIHFDSVQGPGITSCNTCHGAGSADGEHSGHRNDIKNFADGDTKNLSQTSVCDGCHSPGGAFNGVNSSGQSIGAKDNWTLGVYDTTSTLAAGKNKWCVGCHDNSPSTINGQAAPGVGGDNTDYGFFKSGHGLSSSAQYDDDAIGDALGNTGAQIDCDDCHDLAKAHLNGADDSGFDGQRLSGSVNSTATASIFAVCKACHQSSGGPQSADKQVSTHGNDGAGGYTSPIEEPFTVECQKCHEVHGNNYAGGSRNLKMVRTNVNGGTVAFRSASGVDSFDESDAVDADDICVTCHISSANNPGYPTVQHSGGNNHATAGDQRGNDCTICHQHDYQNDATVTPNDGFMPGGGCDVCHTFPAGGTQSTYKGSKTHSVHVDTYGYGCSVCHNAFPAGHNESGVSSKDDWAANFDPANVDVVFNSLNPGGESTIVAGGLGDQNRQCSNLYCHAQLGSVNGKPFSDLGGTNEAGNIPTWDNENNLMAANRYDVVKLTGACGTCHDTTKDNSAQSGTFWPTWNTSDSVNDWSDATAAVIWDMTSGTSIGTTATQVAHGAHLDKLRGPKSVCAECHASPPTVTGAGGPTGKHVNHALDFKDSTTSVASTTACSDCHSPNGAHNGVNDTSQSVGAKDNWATGVYTAGEKLDSANEKWCIGCHDNNGNGATIRGVTAPAVDGDGATYGFYATGHGQQQMVKCTDCHDAGLEHIDGEKRTYAYQSVSQSASFYRQGYRLQMVDGDYPMIIPMTGSTVQSTDKNFKLCLACHRQDSIFSTDTTYPATNFRVSGPYGAYSGSKDNAVPVNNHNEMLNPSKPAATANLWDSDWDTNTGGVGQYGFDSGPLCVTCHNVHGSTYPTMLRDGKLSGKDASTTGYDGVEFSYVLLESTETSYPFPPPFDGVPWEVAWADSTGANRENSMGGVMRFVGAKADQRICSTESCHGTDPADIAPDPRYWVNQPLFLGGELNLLDYYRKPVPVVTSALYKSDNTVTVVFTEPINATAADFTDLQGSSGPLTKNFIAGAGTNIIQINVNSTTDTTGTLDIGPGVTSVANGTALSTVNNHRIWSGRD